MRKFPQKPAAPTTIKTAIAQKSKDERNAIEIIKKDKGRTILRYYTLNKYELPI